MIEFPGRLTKLIERIEAGETVTQEEVDRIATLQALDLVVVGQKFVAEAVRREEQHTQEFANV